MNLHRVIRRFWHISAYVGCAALPNGGYLVVERDQRGLIVAYAPAQNDTRAHPPLSYPYSRIFRNAPFSANGTTHAVIGIQGGIETVDSGFYTRYQKKIAPCEKDMRKVFIDCGIREGDAVAAFLGDTTDGSAGYRQILKSRSDAHEFEIVGFESADYKYLTTTANRFRGNRFTLITKLIWTHDGTVEFDTDGESDGSRLLEVSSVDGGTPQRINNPAATIRQLPCIDFAKILLEEFAPSDFIVIKMDIEGAEYDVLRRIIDTGALSRISELYVEYHGWGRVSLRKDIESYVMAQPGIYYRGDWP